MYVCMYVRMYGGHSVLRSNPKLHDNFGKMQTHARPRMPHIILVSCDTSKPVLLRWSPPLGYIQESYSSLIQCADCTCTQHDSDLEITTEVDIARGNCVCVCVCVCVCARVCVCVCVCARVCAPP